MNNVYVRLIVYVLSTFLALIPLAWGSWVNFNADTGMLTIHVEGAVAALVLALGGSAGVFKIWGTK